MKKIKELYDDIMELTGEITKDHVGAYAAQTAFFFMLCMIPIILLLLTMVQYTPVTKADVMTAVIQVFPSSVDSLITSIVNQVYNQSSGIIPITIVVALWSAGKGVLAMSSGLNCVYNCRETRNYFFLRPLINDFLRKMAKFRHQENQDVSAGTRIRFFIDKPAAMISFPRAVIKYL